MRQNRNADKAYLMLQEPRIYRAFLQLALPVIAANMFRSLNDMVDGYFIGHMVDSVPAQAGISVTWPILNIMMAFGVGLSVAGVSIISQNLGAGKKERAVEYSGLLLLFSVAVGLVANLLLYFLTPVLLTLMNAEGAVYEAGLTYIRVRSFEMIPLFVFSSFQAIRQAKGDTTTPVIFSVISICFNIVLTGIFVQVLDLRVYGAALATLIGNTVIIPPILYMLFRRSDELAINLRVFCNGIRRERHRFFEHAKLLVRMALPSAASQALSSLGFLILQAVILSYGDSVAAAFSNGNKISNLLLIPVMAFGNVMSAFVGQNIGAGNKERAKQSYRVSRNSALAFAVCGALILYPFREWALGLLTNDAETLSIGMEYIFWVLLTQPLMSLFQNYLGVFNGSGNTRYSFIIASARLWIVRLPMILAFKYLTDFGRNGIWYAMVLSNVIILVLANVLLRRVDFERKI